jgi:hypothetical protein
MDEKNWEVSLVRRVTSVELLYAPIWRERAEARECPGNFCDRVEKLSWLTLSEATVGIAMGGARCCSRGGACHSRSPRFDQMAEIRCPLAALTLVVANLCSGIAVYIDQPGGRVRNPEFRPSETPTPASETDHHDKKLIDIHPVNRFEPLGRLCNGSTTAADS